MSKSSLSGSAPCQQVYHPLASATLRQVSRLCQLYFELNMLNIRSPKKSWIWGGQECGKCFFLCVGQVIRIHPLGIMNIIKEQLCDICEDISPRLWSLDRWTDGWTDGWQTDKHCRPTWTPPLPWLKITWLKVRVAWSEDRVLIHQTPSVHVLVMSQDVISSISKWKHTSQSVLVILQWVISRGYFFLMICIAAVLLRIYCIDV